ncbi:MGDG synthase family glycosyltransferase [Sporolituus thermophilus]|uniref:Processive 1,2-diacylglycerol beta-glucosyltransferase n=1 Tax=Sporolituus thermophilus DSM 23256 TaxID=1123285 RepID=A0A1G7LXN3_9FIRM|nr:glycosyltransferase [Sporolituus thermophilus]SDF54328.1 processive 1,2-diacylglycerol beta-glucosyltransferase [Sporolituus thermophilus DSM 23256]
MTNTYRILIISASVGSGHHQAAQALRQALLSRCCRVDVVDFFGGEHRYAGKLIKAAYFRLLRLFPEIYDYLYHYTDASRYGESIKGLLDRLSRRYIRRLIRRYRPDVLVFTHPFPCGAAAGLKRADLINVPLVAVVTDFAVHRLWEYPEVDDYCVASDGLVSHLVRKGYDLSRVHGVGVPIRPVFAELDGTARRPGHVLVMGGGVGLGPAQEVVQALMDAKGVTAIHVVCGKNVRLYRSLQAMVSTNPRLHLYQYTSLVPQLMAAAEVLITKPGGLTASEALAAGLPMVLVDAIGGQEEDNARFLTATGAALWAHDAETAARCTETILNDSMCRAKMQESCRRLARPQAARAVAEIVIQAAQRKGK